jgi:hypothetical protein
MAALSLREAIHSSCFPRGTRSAAPLGPQFARIYTPVVMAVCVLLAFLPWAFTYDADRRKVRGLGGCVRPSPGEKTGARMTRKLRASLAPLNDCAAPQFPPANPA